MKRFFCENCGKEVDEREELCSHCGAVFVAIKCPRCGYRGKQHHFRRGCPACGFLSDENPVKDQVIGSAPIGDDGVQTGVEVGIGTKKARRYARTREPMPEWLFWIALAGLALAFTVLAAVYLRM
jgi:hypothetical protein